MLTEADIERATVRRPLKRVAYPSPRRAIGRGYGRGEGPVMLVCQNNDHFPRFGMLVQRSTKASCRSLERHNSLLHAHVVLLHVQPNRIPGYCLHERCDSIPIPPVIREMVRLQLREVGRCGVVTGTSPPCPPVSKGLQIGGGLDGMQHDHTCRAVLEHQRVEKDVHVRYSTYLCARVRTVRLVLHLIREIEFPIVVRSVVESRCAGPIYQVPCERID